MINNNVVNTLMDYMSTGIKRKLRYQREINRPYQERLERSKMSRVGVVRRKEIAKHGGNDQA